ncbi:alpha-glucosidase family protein [Deefgea tanakiae]|uniref:Alpha-glucosidase family protein n=1 Tax=Deefgea tanakiae TaxID=2865840 RepID=A0ABX8Z707_9NEIS|nr:alpha-glucosidase [Deefgea tanakiae]QZA76699.1 alpha-glucosidase family protein [Deefgea tanakiae]
MAKKNPDWWRGAVIYQIYPRSFKDSNGDGVGDLRGIIQQMPYLQSLNVDALWISPFFKSPMADFGYDVSDYREVDPLFGTLDDFDELLKVAHKAKLKIIIDQVLSHTSDQHAWFKESRSSRDNPKSDWYVWADPQPDGTPPNNWLSVFGGSAWQWDSRRCQYYMHNFLTSQPDLNFHCKAVQKAILGEIEFWLERGVDGFRFDACIFHFHDQQLRSNPAAIVADTTSVAASNPYGMQQHVYDKSQPENIKFLQKLRKLLNKYKAASIGEIGDDDSPSRIAEYTEGGDKFHQAYSFDLLTETFSASHIRKIVETMESKFAALEKPGWTCWSIGNHDVPRVTTRWGKGQGGAQFSKLMMALQASLRGSVCLYQGDELGLTEADIPFELLQDPYGITFWPEFKGRDGCRTPMPWQAGEAHAGFTAGQPWLPIPAEHALAAVDTQEKPRESVLNFSRRFLAWRRRNAVLVTGEIQFLATPEPILLFERSNGKDHVLVAFNLGDQTQTIALPKGWDKVTAMDGHGLMGGAVDKKQIVLKPWGGYFGRM